MSTKKPSKRGKPTVRVSNPFALLGSSIAPDLDEDPDEARIADERLEAQRLEQLQTLRDLNDREVAIEASLAPQDVNEARAIADKAPLQSPTNSPFDPSVHKVRRYGIIKEKEAADIENSIFQRLRASMFKTGKGGMFMFGTPDSVVLTLLSRVYNENIIRIAKQIPSEFSKINAMLGVLHMNDNSIYVTISEDPREDDGYSKKTQLIYTLLTYTNCNVIYDEEDDDDPEVRRAFGSRWSILFPKTPFVYRDLSREPVACLTREESDNVQNGLIMGTGNRRGNSGYDFNKTIISDRLNVHFIHSLRYLVGRRPENPATSNLMFPPIKKPADGRPGFHECANGSTCSEAKIFSYIHQHYDIPSDHPGVMVQRSVRQSKRTQQISPAEATFRRIRGYGAYWIPAANPPDHILGNYNYKLDPNDKFKTESFEIMSIIKQNVPDFMAAAVNTPQFAYFAQLFALPCPGCFLNYNNYIKNTMTQYNLSTCIKSRKGRLYASGGKRHRPNKTIRKSARSKGNHTRKCRCRTCRGTKRMRK
jgi:hypothetical protein